MTEVLPGAAGTRVAAAADDFAVGVGEAAKKPDRCDWDAALGDAIEFERGDDGAALLGNAAACSRYRPYICEILSGFNQLRHLSASSTMRLGKTQKSRFHSEWRPEPANGRLLYRRLSSCDFEDSKPKAIAQETNGSGIMQAATFPRLLRSAALACALAPWGHRLGRYNTKVQF
jgi:hypothetical protein